MPRRFRHAVARRRQEGATRPRCDDVARRETCHAGAGECHGRCGYRWPRWRRLAAREKSRGGHGHHRASHSGNHSQPPTPPTARISAPLTSAPRTPAAQARGHYVDLVAPRGACRLSWRAVSICTSFSGETTRGNREDRPCGPCEWWSSSRCSRRQLRSGSGTVVLVSNQGSSSSDHTFAAFIVGGIRTLKRRGPIVASCAGDEERSSGDDVSQHDRQLTSETMMMTDGYCLLLKGSGGGVLDVGE